MTDAEITRLCAEAMPEWQRKARLHGMKIDPLHRKEQAMELVEAFHLDISACENSFEQLTGWIVFGEFEDAEDENLNRAICLCVIKNRGI